MIVTDGADKPALTQPLAWQMRPQRLEELIGQEHLMGPGKPLYQALVQNQLHSMVFWGPSGVGKTTVARMIAEYTDAEFVSISAVLSGVKEVRDLMSAAEQRKRLQQQETLLFVDEVHRFNKAQQDAFLLSIEQGSIIFVGATVENPSFELNKALLSRVRVYVFQSLSIDQLAKILNRAISQKYRDKREAISEKQLQSIASYADGDARRSLNILEIAMSFIEGMDSPDKARLKDAHLKNILSEGLRYFDKGGEHFYDQISALHKSVRGSDPDAALYWFCRMLDGGCEPRYIARRLIRIAVEDIGNADPRALSLCNDAAQAYERLGSPEGELALAQAVIYLAVAAKSNAVYTAYNRATADIRSQPSYEVPFHLRNAPTKLMKQLGYGHGYRYPHDEDSGYAAGENYFPEALKGKHYYEPTERGIEAKIRQKLKHLRQLKGAE